MSSRDARLVREAKRGSVDAVAQLFDAYWLVAWRAAWAVTGRRELANDAAQDAFIRALGALSSFDERRPFAPWLARIAVNRALDLVRRERLRAVAGSPDETVAAHDAERDLALHGAVARLPLERRVVVVLHYWLDLPVREVALLLDTPVGTVASRLARALDDLRNDLEAEYV